MRQMIQLLCSECGGPLKPSELYYNEGRCSKCREPTLIRANHIDDLSHTRVNKNDREFYEECHECGFKPTIEEKRDYKGILLSVSVCPICHFFDWMLPPEWDEDDIVTLDLTHRWAEEESIKILKERNIFYKIRFSEASKEILYEKDIIELKPKIAEICDILDTNKAEIGKFKNGVKIWFPRPYGLDYTDRPISLTKLGVENGN